MTHESELSILTRRYEELIMAVENKHLNECRHDTALRLIKEGQASSGESSSDKDIT